LEGYHERVLEWRPKSGIRSEIALRFLSFSGFPDLHYNNDSWVFPSPPDAMPSSRRNLTLDEQSFQGLLSAAFVIQEHNDQRKRARRALAESDAAMVGQQGNAPHAGETSRSESSGLDEARPGERLQHSWASMWLMSQERDLRPEIPAEVAKRPISQEENDAIRERGERRVGESGSDDRAVIQSVLRQPELNRAALGEAALDEAELGEAGAESRRTTDSIIEALAPEDSTGEDANSAGEPFGYSASDESSPVFSLADGGGGSWMRRLAGGRVKLRFRRADLYLGTAILVAALALLWPAASSPRRAALSPWERALVAIGIAEAPAPVIHLQGDPGIEVWVDPHSALYYCPGEEQYGKTSDGRLSSQHDAQMDRFEPAGRSACE
jgi:hypothetical protein